MNLPVPFGPTGEVVYSRTYSRTKPDGSKETWPETVERVVRGNLALVHGNCDDKTWPAEVQAEYLRLRHYMERFAILPAGRHLWATGATNYLFNCHTSGWGEKLSEHFEFTSMRLFEGGGVGSNYSTKYLEKYGAPRRQVNAWIVCDPGHPDYAELEPYLASPAIRPSTGWDYSGPVPLRKPGFAPGDGKIVVDSREGWAEALVDLIDTTMTDDYDDGLMVRIYDVSGIRPSGSPLVTSGGTASGPAPLARMLHAAVAVLNRAHDARRVSPLDAMEIDHAIAEAVVSGGTRRSARMSIVRWDDPYIKDFLRCKTDTGKHWTTNISVEIDGAFFRHLSMPGGSHANVAKAVHEMVVRGMLTNGEPGYWNASRNAEGEVGDTYACNPCQPAWARLLTPDGIRTMGEIEVGDTVWSEDGWVKVIRKTATGVKQVNRYRTTAGFVDATENHRIVSNGVKAELKDAESIDRLRGVDTSSARLEPKDILAGLLLGDGHLHTTQQYAYAILNIGENDQDYFNSEVAGLINARHGSDRQFRTDVVIDPAHLVPLPERRMPEELIGNAAVLRGLYSANGSVVGKRVAFKTTSAAMRDDVMVALSALGIAAYYTTNKPSVIEWSNGTYESRESYDVNIGRGDDILRFMNKVGFIQEYKMEKLAKILRASSTNPDKTFDVISVESMGKHEVWDITVDGPRHTYWSDGMNVSNCGEVTLEPWEACNLGHVNLDAFAPQPDGKGGRTTFDYDGMKEAHRLVTRFLIRATFGDVSDPKQAAILARNRRIGVGHLGVQGFWAKLGVKYSEIQTSGSSIMLSKLYGIVRQEARDYAFELRIPEPVKVTTVAPTGSVAKLPGTTEGIHPVYARWFEQRIRFSLRDAAQWAQVARFRAEGFKVEDDVYDKSGQTAVVVFPTENILLSQVRALGWRHPEDLVQSAEELTIEDMLNVQRHYQEHWADNAVSYTVNIPEGTVSADELAGLLAEYLPHLKGTTIMVDATRPQAPYTRITQEQYTVAAAKTVEDSTDLSCSSGACPVR